MTDREAVSRLTHDVGKYIARTARNLSGRPVDAVLLSMLVRDLYELGPERESASRLFERRAAPLGDTAPLAPPLAEVRALLAILDQLEPRVRAGDSPAVARALELALQVEERLRALAT